MQPKTDEKLNESGTILYLREHTESTTRMTRAVWTLIILIAILFIFSFWYIKEYNVVAYPVNLLKEIAVNCAIS